MAQNTLTAKLQFLNEAGIDIIQSVGIGGAVQWSLNANGGIQVVAQPLAATGPLSGRIPGFFVITAGAAATITLSAPTAGVDDGLEIEIFSNTAFAHVVAVGAGKLKAGAAAPGAQITFPAFAGAGVYLTAYQGAWLVATGGNGTYVVA